MARVKSSAVAPMTVLVLISLGVLALAVPDDASRTAVPILGVILLLATVAVPRLGRSGGFPRGLLAVVLAAIAARLLLFAFVHVTVGPIVFAPDAISYQNEGLALSRWWSGTGPTPVTERYSAYGYFTGALFFVFNEARSAPAVINLFIGAWVAFPVFFLTKRLVRGNETVATIAAALAAFFPSLMLWSVLNIRDAPTILTIVFVVFLVDRFRERFTATSVLGLVAGLSILAASREYIMVLVALSAGAGLLVARSRSPLRNAVVGAVLLFGTIVVVRSTGVGGILLEEPSLEQLTFLREDLMFGAGSQYGYGFDTSTPAGALAFLPVGLVYFLFAPFPWAVTSFLQSVTVPEILLWYALIPFFLWGLILALQHEPRKFAVLITVMATVTVAYAMVEGNVGTAYRHRGQVLPMFFVFCAIGLGDAYAIRAGRRQARASMRAASRGALTSRGGGQRRVRNRIAKPRRGMWRGSW